MDYWITIQDHKINAYRKYFQYFKTIDYIKGANYFGNIEGVDEGPFFEEVVTSWAHWKHSIVVIVGFFSIQNKNWSYWEDGSKWNAPSGADHSKKSVQENPTEEIIVGKEYMKKKWYVIIRDNITNIINSSLIFVGESINSF